MTHIPRVSTARCRSCEVRQKGICGALSALEFKCLEHASRTMTYDAGSTLFEDGAPGQWGYTIVEGVVRRTRVLRGGQRQVFGFFGPGDFLAWIRNGTYSASAEAVTAVKVCRFPFKALACSTTRQQEVEGYFQHISWLDMDDAQAQLSMLMRKSALGKVSAFILYFADRISRQATTDWVELPMKREDIADYLGMATETVCRCFTQLAHENILKFDSIHSVHILCRNILEDYANGDSRPSSVQREDRRSRPPTPNRSRATY